MARTLRATDRDRIIPTRRRSRAQRRAQAAKAAELELMATFGPDFLVGFTPQGERVQQSGQG